MCKKLSLKFQRPAVCCTSTIVYVKPLEAYSVKIVNEARLPLLDGRLVKWVHLLPQNLRNITLASSFLFISLFAFLCFFFVFVFAVLCCYCLSALQAHSPAFSITWINQYHCLKLHDCLCGDWTVTYNNFHLYLILRLLAGEQNKTTTKVPIHPPPPNRNKTNNNNNNKMKQDMWHVCTQFWHLNAFCFSIFDKQLKINYFFCVHFLTTGISPRGSSYWCDFRFLYLWPYFDPPWRHFTTCLLISSAAER